jgi:hypothetical protein
LTERVEMEIRRSEFAHNEIYGFDRCSLSTSTASLKVSVKIYISQRPLVRAGVAAG